MFNLDLRRLARVTGPLALALAVTLSAGSVHARVTKPGSNAGDKVLPYPGPLHGPGSSHNPIVVTHGPLHGPGSSHNPIVVTHGPLHGPGSSHNPIVVPPDCNDPDTLCRRP